MSRFNALECTTPKTNVSMEKPIKKAGINETQPCEISNMDMTTRKNHYDGASYRRKFLKNNPQGRRVQVYIDHSLHEQIKRFLPAVAPDVSLSSYITNIVEAHFERYIDEINRRYEMTGDILTAGTGINRICRIIRIWMTLNSDRAGTIP